jgi:hypothetical protein
MALSANGAAVPSINVFNNAIAPVVGNQIVSANILEPMVGNTQTTTARATNGKVTGGIEFNYNFDSSYDLGGLNASNAEVDAIFSDMQTRFDLANTIADATNSAVYRGYELLQEYSNSDVPLSSAQQVLVDSYNEYAASQITPPTVWERVGSMFDAGSADTRSVTRRVGDALHVTGGTYFNNSLDIAIDGYRGADTLVSKGMFGALGTLSAVPALLETFTNEVFNTPSRIINGVDSMSIGLTGLVSARDADSAVISGLGLVRDTAFTFLDVMSIGMAGPARAGATNSLLGTMEGNIATNSELLIKGAAFRHQTKWAPNAAGPRSVDDALKLADDYGVYVADDVKIRFIDDKEYDLQFGVWGDSYASYGHIRTQNLNQQVTFKGALADKDGNINIYVRNSILESDESIVAVLHHETHEVEALREIFAKRASLPAREYGRLINDSTPGNLHWEAVDVGDQAVWQFRQDRGL